MSTQIMHPAELEARLQARVDELRRSAAREKAPRRRWGLRPVSLAAAGLVATAMFAAVAAAVVNDSKNCSIEVADKTGYAICTTTQNATVEFIGDSNETFGSSGSGVFNSFVRVQANGTEDGYNTDGDLEFDTKSGNFTHAILVSAIPVVFLDPDGAGPAPFGAYWELFADLNEGNTAASKLLSLNDVEVYFTTDPELTGYDFGTDAEKVYDFSGSIKINDVNQGSGRGDIRYRIPLLNIDVPDGCNYGEPSCLTYFVLYNQWGTTTNYGSDATFEEFKVKQYPTLQIVKTAVGGDDTFTYTVTGPSTPLVPAPSITTVSGTGATPTYIVNPGTYTIDEDGPPSGWTLTGAVCSVNGGAPAAYTEGSNLVLGETTHVVCTFTNTKDGRIEIEKQTLPDADPATFDFTGDVAGTLGDGDSTGEDVAPGSYSSTETIPAGWALTDITCDDSDSTGDPATGVASFEVAAGETVRCVFTNTKQVQNVGCTPGFWQGGFGVKLWDEPTDPDWASNGGDSTWNPFVTTDTFTPFFLASGNSFVDNSTMLTIVGSGGTNSWPRKAARDLIAAYLNASFFGSSYPYDTTTILSDWSTAVAGGTSGFQAFHLKYAAANELGCPIGAPIVLLSKVGDGGLLLVLLPAGPRAIRRWRLG